MLISKVRRAFSMLELIFVIVILGIIASIASEMIAKVYEQYIIQRAQYKASMKTEIAATQIANRLAAAIPGTVYRIRRVGGALEPVDSAFTGTSIGDDYNGIQWVGSDIDSFSTNTTPGWSGFCDIDDSNQTSLSTPGSNLATTTTIINNLSSGTPTPVIYFPYDSEEYNASISGSDITFTGGLPDNIVEQYKLAWSSYAIRVVNGDLILYYDFPANREAPFANARSSLLMRNISTFKFQAAGRTIRFKLCREERIGEDFNVTACKEKAVF